MSHVATNWAFQQTDLTPHQWRVLMNLADCHNPEHGCFPSQQFLAERCRMSRRGVNLQLDTLEEMGLISRQRQLDDATKRRKSTRYILGFEMESHVHDVHTEGPSHVHEVHTTHVHEVHTNPVTSLNPVTFPPNVPPNSFAEFWAAYPRKVARGTAENAWAKAVKETAPEIIISAVKQQSMAMASQPSKFIPHPATWLNGKRWLDEISHLKEESSRNEPISTLEISERAREIAISNQRAGGVRY